MSRMLSLVGLAILVVVVLFSGCQEKEKPSCIAIDSIKLQPEVYLNKTITIRAFYDGVMEWICEKPGSEESCLPIRIPESVDKSMLVYHGEYYFTGVLLRNFTLYGSQFDGLYLNVLDISVVS